MLPVRKTSKSRTRTRRSHQALREPALVRCPKCGQRKISHSACGNCGYYSQRVSLEVETEES